MCQWLYPLHLWNCISVSKQPFIWNNGDGCKTGCSSCRAGCKRGSIQADGRRKKAERKNTVDRVWIRAPASRKRHKGSLCKIRTKEKLDKTIISNPHSHTRHNHTSPFMQHKNSSIVPPDPSTEVSSLAQAIQDSITINRLPMPTPTVFEGDPIHYIKWRALFISLIDRRGLSSASI